MKRYLLKQDDTNDEPMMAESEDGEWVRFEDVEKEKFSGIAKAIIIIANDLEKKRLECSCIDEQSAGNKYWFCPAHGYKRL